MKWTNKGHEFDEMYKYIKIKKEFYLFGAGDYGNLFLSIMKKEIKILGFVDNDKNKQEKGYLGYPVFPLDKLKTLTDTQGVILTISQFLRASAQAYLDSLKLIKGKHYFLFEEFLSVYNVYKYDRVYLSSISFLPSTICNLKCIHCLNFNPFAKKFYQREYDELIKDLDLFFEKVDRIMIFHLSGGEPMLYPQIGKLIRYIDIKYGEKIDAFRTVTNGTIIPSVEVLRDLAGTNVEVTVDDYRDAVPKYADRLEQLVALFEQYHVRYIINRADSWVDLGPEKTDYSNYGDEWLENHFNECCQTWQELRDGKLYSCNYAAYATVAGIAGEQDLEEVYDLTKVVSNKKKELVEFRLRYTNKGYTNFCKKCRGFTMKNDQSVKPAMQVGESNV